MSQAAIRFWTAVANTHGRHVGDGRVWVGASQARLAQERGCSAGTVAYYLRSVGEAVQRRRGGLLIDPAVLTTAASRVRDRSRALHRLTLERLTEAWPCRLAGEGRYELLVDGIRCPTESDVAAVLGVARSAAHERLVRLEAARLLERNPGRWLANLTGPPQHLIDPAPGQTESDALAGVSTPGRHNRFDSADETGHVAGFALDPADMQALSEAIAAGVAAGIAAALPQLRSTDPRTDAEQIREVVHDCVADLLGVPSRGSRFTDAEKQVSNSFDTENPLLTSFAREPRTPTAHPEFADSEPMSQAGEDGGGAVRSADRHPESPVTAGADEEPVGAERAFQLVAPLIRAQQEAGELAYLHRSSSAVLGRLSEAQLRRGIANATASFAGGRGSSTRPVGALVTAAKNGDVGYFAAPPPPPPPKVAVQDEDPATAAAAAYISELEADPARRDELDELDEAVKRWQSTDPLQQRMAHVAGAVTRDPDRSARMTYLLVHRTLEQAGASP